MNWPRERNEAFQCRYMYLYNGYEGGHKHASIGESDEENGIQKVIHATMQRAAHLLSFLIS